jgi:ornithine cyclodeaminase/alanine dehydrogenase-like protein (mu-crystallin family)
MTTLLLTRSEVEALLDPAALVEPLRAGFVHYSSSAEGRARRVRSSLPGPGTATVLFPGTAPGVPAYTVKVHAKFPAEVPAIRGVLCLHDMASGRLLAIMDSTYLTAVRTGLAGALAAHTLARQDADVVAVIGAGVQGTHQLRSLATLRSITHVHVYDIDPARAESFVRTTTETLGIPVTVAVSTAAAVNEAGISLIATWSRTPIVLPGMLPAGAHVTTLGADEPGKVEVDPELIRTSLFVCDDRKLALELGALYGAGPASASAAVELGDVFAGAHPGRTSDHETTIYGGVGLAFQDTIVAWQIYLAAMARGPAREIDFLA